MGSLRKDEQPASHPPEQLAVVVRLGAESIDPRARELLGASSGHGVVTAESEMEVVVDAQALATSRCPYSEHEPHVGRSAAVRPVGPEERGVADVHGTRLDQRVDVDADRLGNAW